MHKVVDDVLFKESKKMCFVCDRGRGRDPSPCFYDSLEYQHLVYTDVDKFCLKYRVSLHYAYVKYPLLIDLFWMFFSLLYKLSGSFIFPIIHTCNLHLLYIISFM